MRKVWYISNIADRMDISSASSFGQLYPIFTGVTPFEIHRQQSEVCTDILPNSNEKDLILLTGPASMVATLSSLWYERFGIVRFLLWDFSKSKYVEHFLDKNRNPHPR